MMTIEERLRNVAERNLQPFNYGNFTMIPLDKWISDSRTNSKQKGIHKIFPQFENEDDLEKREINQNNFVQYKKLKDLLNYIISSEILDLNMIKNQYIDFKENQINSKSRTHSNKDYFNIPYFVEESLFQFPEIVKEKINLMLNINLFKDQGINPHNNSFRLLCDYSKFYPELSERTLNKCKEGYEFNKNYLGLQRIIEKVIGIESIKNSNRNFDELFFRNNPKEQIEFKRIPDKIKEIYYFHGPEISYGFGGNIVHGENLKKRVHNYKNCIDLLEESMK